MRDAVGYRDEGEEINDVGRIVVIISFCLFIVFSIGSTLFSLCGVSPRCTLFWAMIMWFMLTVAFCLVGVLNVGREISRESCLYIDTFAVKELRDEVNQDPERTEALLWYYFRARGTIDPPFQPADDVTPVSDNRNRNLTQLEDLWGFPLTDVTEFLNTVEDEIFDENGERAKHLAVSLTCHITHCCVSAGVAFPYSLAGNTTQEALIAVQRLVPQARRDIEYVQDLIGGETLHTIHSDFKDLLCCTEYDSVDAVWKAWVVSSAFGLIIAILMTLQGLMSLRFGRSSHPASFTTAAARVPTQKTSAYMAPPVAEGNYTTSDAIVTGRDSSGTPLRKDNTTSDATVKYPTLNPPGAYL